MMESIAKCLTDETSSVSRMRVKVIDKLISPFHFSRTVITLGGVSETKKKKEEDIFTPGQMSHESSSNSHKTSIRVPLQRNFRTSNLLSNVEKTIIFVIVRQSKITIILGLLILIP